MIIIKVKGSTNKQTKILLRAPIATRGPTRALKLLTRVLERKEGVFKIEPSLGRAIKRKECLPEPVYLSVPISRDAILFVLR